MRTSSINWFGALLLVVLVIGFGADSAMAVVPPVDADAATLVADAGATADESKLAGLWKSTGIHGFFHNGGWKNGAMILIGLLLIYLGIAKKFEPLLLIPIGFGGILANIPYAGIADPGVGE